MDEIGIAVLVLLGLGAVFVGAVLGFIALLKIGALRQDLNLVGLKLRELQNQLLQLQKQPPAAPPPAPPMAAEEPASAAPVPQVQPALPVRPAPQSTASPTAPIPAVAPGSTVLPAPIVLPVAASSAATMQGLESKIGQRWIAWIGAVVVFLSAVFFLKLAFDNKWIGPTGQVIICALVGAAMLATGSRFVGKRWRILGQCLMGLGLGILYATFYAAFSVYAHPVMSQQIAFACMIGVTVAGMALAILHDAVALAFLAVLGGMLTPVLVSTGQNARDALFTYILLLDLGVLAVAFFRGWRLLDTLALAGTIIMYAGWHEKFYTLEVLVPALVWLGGFYLLFLVLPFAYHLVRRQNVTLERFIMALANAVFAAGYAWAMLHRDYLFSMGFVMLGMAGAYLVLGALLRRRLPNDARALFGLIAMTVTFLTLAVPMQLRAHGILLAWVAEAPVLAFLAYRFRYRPVRVFAALVLLVAVGRLFFSEAHWPLHTGLFVPFFNAQLLSALTVPAGAALYAWIHQRCPKDATPLDRALQTAAALVAGLLSLIILHAEVYGWVNNDYGPYLAASAVVALWALGAGVFLWAGTRTPRVVSWVWGVGVLALAVAAVLGVIDYSDTTDPHHVLLLNARFLAGLLAAGGGFAYARVLGRGAALQSPRHVAGLVLLTAGTLGLLVLLSTEVYAYCMDTIADRVTAGRAAQMSISLVWSLYAATLLAGGFWRRWRPLRLGGLALFGLAAIKLVLLDLTYLKDVYRVVSFLVLGLLMLAVSYFYHRLEKRLATVKSDPAPENV